MKKRKFLWSLIAIIMAVISVALTACSKDDENEGDDNVIGEWKGYKALGDSETYFFVFTETEVTMTSPNGATTKGTYTITSTRTDKIDGSKEGKGTITWDNGKAVSFTATVSDMHMVLIVGSAVYNLTRVTKSDPNGNNGTLLIGTWGGDRSESYFEVWTFNTDGSGEQYVHDGDLGSYNKFTYKIVEQDSQADDYWGTVTYGKLTINFNSGRTVTWSFSQQGSSYLSINGYSMHKEK